MDLVAACSSMKAARASGRAGSATGPWLEHHALQTAVSAFSARSVFGDIAPFGLLPVGHQPQTAAHPAGPDHACPEASVMNDNSLIIGHKLMRSLDGFQGPRRRAFGAYFRAAGSTCPTTDEKAKSWPLDRKIANTRKFHRKRPEDG